MAFGKRKTQHQPLAPVQLTYLNAMLQTAALQLVMAAELTQAQDPALHARLDQLAEQVRAISKSYAATGRL